MTKLELSNDELDVVAHTLGINFYNAKLSKKKKDKKLPKEFYRNYYCASVNHHKFPVLSDLQLTGVMKSWTQFDNLYFCVTEEGIELFKKEFKRQINLS